MIYFNKLSALLVLLLLSLLPTFALGCVPAKVSLVQRVEAAQAIYIGVVTNVIDNTKIEVNTELNEMNPPDNNLSISPSVKPYSIKVLVTHVVKGKNNPTNIQPSITNCGSGSASQDDKVIVFLIDGYWYTNVFEKETYTEILALVK